MKYWFSLLCLLFCSLSQAQSDIEILRYSFNVGDNPTWSSTEFNDSQWPTLSQQSLPKQKTQYWLRSHIDVKHIPNDVQMAAFITVLGSYQIFWDGEPLGQSGTYGQDEATEKPGPIISQFRLNPNQLSPGKHVVAMRVSNFHSPADMRGHYFRLFLVSQDRLEQTHMKHHLPPVLVFGALLIIAIFYLQLYFIYSPNASFLLFGLLCLAVSALLVTETYKGLFGYSYDWHKFRLIAVSVLTFIVTCLLPSFFIQQFGLKRKRLWIGLISLTLACVAVLFPGYDNSCEMMFLLSLAICVLVAIHALRHKQQGALLALCGLLFVWATKALLPDNFQDSFFFPSFGILILFMLTALTLRMKTTSQERDKALLNSAQLEIMLLKKNIQPHFILNTLTSIEQWIEEEPKTAVKFIDALADEFRVMNEMADCQKVTLAQELALCRSHLKIMSYRKDMGFSLTTIDIKTDTMLPPAILHTLIENALTHNLYLSGDVELVLQQSQAGQMVCLELKAPLSQTRQKERLSTGTGMKYIKSRLEESYPGNWSVIDKQDSNYWITQLIFKEQR